MMNYTRLLACSAVAITMSVVATPGRGAERTTSSLAISGMVIGFAPDRATGVMYPSDFCGPVYSVDNDTRELVGWYSEKTKYPVIVPGANPLGFVGTVGIAEFTFEQNGKVVGTITTMSYAEVVKENAPLKTDFAKGILCARATGFVIEGTGIYHNAAGSFTTRSSVNLGLLTLETKLELTLWERSPKPKPVLHLVAAASCCRPAAPVQQAAYYEPAQCTRPVVRACYEQPEEPGLLSRGCRLIRSPLRCVFR